jgi:protein-S-isoprenylcysteine O-methyltransferase Ste14
MVLATIGYLGLYPGTFVVDGFDTVRFGPAIPIPPSIQIIAFVVFALGYGFAFWAVLSNPFFSTFVRIQSDLGHSAVTSGACALGRHPCHAGVPRPW